MQSHIDSYNLGKSDEYAQYDEMYLSYREKYGDLLKEELEMDEFEMEDKKVIYVAKNNSDNNENKRRVNNFNRFEGWSC